VEYGGFGAERVFEVKGNRMNTFDLRLAVILSMAGWLALTVPARGQTIVPVGRQFPPPIGLNFRGMWSCSDGSSTAVAPSTLLRFSVFNNLGNLLFAQSYPNRIKTYDSCTVRLWVASGFRPTGLGLTL
jgi:hypothetical protein